jgi:CheY-like chemotaxis protein
MIGGGVDGDGDVDDTDVGIVTSHLGQTCSPIELNHCCADLNLDGCVNEDDLLRGAENVEHRLLQSGATGGWSARAPPVFRTGSKLPVAPQTVQRFPLRVIRGVRFMMRMRAEKTILVVDDSPAVVLALKRRLETAGLDVLTATSGQEALRIARACPLDAVTLDVEMPGEFSGLSVALALQQNPQTAQVPIVFITGTAGDPFKQISQAVGGRYFLAKPYDGDVLLKRLESIFARDELAEIRRSSLAKRRQPIGWRSLLRALPRRVARCRSASKQQTQRA